MGIRLRARSVNDANTTAAATFRPESSCQSDKHVKVPGFIAGVK